MPFGVPIQEKTAVQLGHVTTVSLTLDSTPTDDNVLVVVGFVYWEGSLPSVTVTTPTGFTVDADIAGSGHSAYGHISHKVASSESTTVTQTASSADEQAMVALEYDEMDTTSLVVGSDFVTGSALVTSRSSGTVNNTASPADALAVAGFGGLRTATSKTASIGFTNSYTLEGSAVGVADGDADCYVTTLVLSATGNTSTTASWTSESCRTQGGLVIFKKGGAAAQTLTPSAVAVPVATPAPTVAFGLVTITPMPVQIWIGGQWGTIWSTDCEDTNLLKSDSPPGVWDGIQLQDGASGETATVALSTDQAHSGTQSIKCFAGGGTTADTGKAHVYNRDRTGPDFIPNLLAHQRYRCTGWYYIPAIPDNIKEITLMDLQGQVEQAGPNEGPRIWVVNANDQDPPHFRLGRGKMGLGLDEGSLPIPRDEWMKLTLDLILDEGGAGGAWFYVNDVLDIGVPGETFMRVSNGIVNYDILDWGLTGNSTDSKTFGVSTDLTIYLDDVLIEHFAWPEPTVTVGGMSVTPATVPTPLVIPAPVVVAGDVTLSLSPVPLPVATPAPTVVFGGISVTPDTIAIPLATPTSTALNIYTVAPSAVPVPLTVATPELVIGIRVQSSVLLGPFADQTISTTSVTPGTGNRRKMLVAVSAEHTQPIPSVSSVTYDGTALTFVTGSLIDLPWVPTQTTFQSSVCWYFLDEANFPSVAADVVVTLSASTLRHAAHVVFLTDAAQGQPDEVATNGALSVTSLSVNYTPTAEPGVALMGAVAGDSAAWNAPNQTLLEQHAVDIYGSQTQYEYYFATSQDAMDTSVATDPFRFLLSVVGVESVTSNAQQIAIMPVAMSLATPAPIVVAGGTSRIPDPVTTLVAVPVLTLVQGPGVQTVTPSPVAVPLSVQVLVAVRTVSVVPDAVAVLSVVPAVGVALGASSLTPDAVPIVLATPPPSILAVGSVGPDPVQLSVAIPAPTIVPGAASLSPEAVTLPFVVAIPSVVQGAATQTLIPNAVAIPLVMPAPAPLAGTLTMLPSAAPITLVVPAPAVLVEALVLTPAPVAVEFSWLTPLVVAAATVLTPDAVAVTITLTSPSVLSLGGVGPGPVAITLVVPSITVVGGASAVSPDPVGIPMMVSAPTVSMGAAALVPAPVAFTFLLPDPLVVSGLTFVTPDPASIPILVPAPLLTGSFGALGKILIVESETLTTSTPTEETITTG